MELVTRDGLFFPWGDLNLGDSWNVECEYAHRTGHHLTAVAADEGKGDWPTSIGVRKTTLEYWFRFPIRQVIMYPLQFE